MSITLPLSFGFPQKFFVSLLFFTSSVHCARSSISSAESSGPTGSSPALAASSLVPTHHRGDLISAQFRAVQDGDNGDPVSAVGLDSLSAAAAAAAGLEEDQLALSKYMAASASAYNPTKIARLNRYTQTGFYDPYPPSYNAAALNSIPSSYYPYNAPSSYRDNYPNFERDRLRELAMQAASSNAGSNRDGYGGGGNYNNGPPHEGFRSTPGDNTAMGSEGGHHGGGGGWGWQYTSKVNTNAIGLLGLLGLLSLLSNVLMQFTTTTTTTTMMMGGRRKRSISYNDEDSLDNFQTPEERRERIFMQILPYLYPVAHARDGLIPPDCTYQGVCMANKVLCNEFGALLGRAGGLRITSAIVKLLEKVPSNSTEAKIGNRKPSDKASKYSYTGKKSSDIRKKLESAGLDGRNKKDCQKSYPVCNALQSQTMPHFPFEIRMQDLPHLISKANKMALQSGTDLKVPMKL